MRIRCFEQTPLIIAPSAFRTHDHDDLFGRAEFVEDDSDRPRVAFDEGDDRLFRVRKQFVKRSQRFDGRKGKPFRLFCGLDHDPSPTLEPLLRAFGIQSNFAAVSNQRDDSTDTKLGRLLHDHVHSLALHESLCK